MTWSPGLTLVTPAPTVSTMPAASWPSTIGSGKGQSPFMMCQSLWHTPAALTRTRASPACGPCCSTSTTSSRMFGLYRTAAFIGDSLAEVAPPGGAVGDTLLARGSAVNGLWPWHSLPVTARRLAIRLHLWGGLVMGPLILALGVSGMALVFRTELEHMIDGAPAVVSPGTP